MLDTVRQLVTDAYYSLQTGMGTARDKREHTGFTAEQELDEATLSALFDHDWLAHRVASTFPAEATRPEFWLNSKEHPQEAEALQGMITAEFRKAFRAALTFGGLYGGGILWALLEDDRSPLAGPPPMGKQVKGWVFIERSKVQELVLDQWGQPLAYRCMPSDGSATVTLHVGRVVRFPGAETSPYRRRELRGWELSTLQRPWGVLRDAGASFASLSTAMQAMTQTVYSVTGLRTTAAQAVADTVLERIRRVELSRGTNRPVVIDAEDGFQVQGVPLTGLGDAIDRQFNLLSGASGIPVAILFGRSAAGMNATGDSDFRAFYDKVQAYQRDVVSPLLVQCAQIYALSKGDVAPSDLEVAFGPLWEPSPKEQAEIYTAQATADQTYVAMGALDAEEVRASRFGDADGAEGNGITLKPDETSVEAERLAAELLGR